MDCPRSFRLPPAVCLLPSAFWILLAARRLALNNPQSGFESYFFGPPGVVMSYKFDRVHVWSCEVQDQAGGVSSKLAFLAQAGANLEYVFTKRIQDKPGSGVLYVAPVSGAAQVRAARAAGMTETDSPIVRRIEGDNEAGLAHRLTQQWAIASISFRSLTMTVLAGKFVGYAAFDTIDDANRAAQILADLGAACSSAGPG
jgi:hypothetical protein